jgi:hypothetical protein
MEFLLRRAFEPVGRTKVVFVEQVELLHRYGEPERVGAGIVWKMQKNAQVIGKVILSFDKCSKLISTMVREIRHNIYGYKKQNRAQNLRN